MSVRVRALLHSRGGACRGSVTTGGNTPVKLLIQPEDGIAPLLAAIKKAKKSVDIVIFRFDRAELEAALQDAAERGVSVSALIAYANHGGEKSLRKLEMRLLEAGVTVSRTADDLARYHDKLLIIDRRLLFVLSFNFTHLDIDHSRGFGVVTKKGKLVQEALKLLKRTTIDTLRGRPRHLRGQPGQRPQATPRAHQQGQERVARLRSQDCRRGDVARALSERAKQGVDVRSSAHWPTQRASEVRPLGGFRLHTRTIVCDRREAFVGSQSLRKAELDSRREVGVIVRDSKVVTGVVNTFEADWRAKETAETMDTPQVLKKKLKDMVEKLSPLNPSSRKRCKKVVSKEGNTGEQGGRERDRREGREGSRPRASPGDVERVG